jgi:hypothetical protein
MERESAPAGDKTPRSARVIRAWRSRMGLTQEALSTVSRWENGHVVPSKLAWRALQNLAAERGCPLDDPDGSEPSS